MKQAIIDTSGHQYIVKPGDELLLDRLSLKEGDKIVFDKVLTVFDGDEIEIGTPHLKGVTVEGKIIEHVRGDKIRVARYKAKSRYRKVKGFRASLTKIKIGKIKDGQN